MKVRKSKGEQGYIDALKKRNLLWTVFLFCIAAAIFVLGLILNKFQKGNVFTIIAAVAVIPAARAATAWILVFPFKSVSETEAEEAVETARGGSIVYSDIILTSTEKAMGLAHMVITGSKIIALTARDKDNAAKIQEYLSDYVSRKGFDYKLTVTDDRKKFLSLLKNSDSVDAGSFANEEKKAEFDKERAELCEAVEIIML